LRTLGHGGLGPDFAILTLHLAGVRSLGGRVNFWSTIKNFLIITFNFLCLSIFN
jgi:heme/copper-type cytochrome/quinol oxidase subunit 1